MNIQYLHGILSRIDEIKVIGKSSEVDGIICNVMGIVRHGAQMHLLILQYDEGYQERIEEREAAELSDTPDIPRSNRMFLRNDRKNEPINPFRSVRKAFIADREFEVFSSECNRLNTQDWEHLLVIAQFLNNGWQPNEIDYQDIDMLFLNRLKLEGDYNSIPVFSQNPELRFVMRPCNEVCQVEKPVALKVGGQYPDKITFRDATTGAEHWVQINRVYLVDIWEEMNKTFSNPEFQEKLTPEEINQVRLNFEKKFTEVCPKGMYFPVVKYECEEDISLQFYSRSYLDAEPVHRSSGMVFMFRPDQPLGILGLKLKAAVIQEPVPADTETIEAEIFQYSYVTVKDDILL